MLRYLQLHVRRFIARNERVCTLAHTCEMQVRGSAYIWNYHYVHSRTRARCKKMSALTNYYRVLLAHTREMQGQTSETHRKYSICTLAHTREMQEWFSYHSKNPVGTSSHARARCKNHVRWNNFGEQCTLSPCAKCKEGIFAERDGKPQDITRAYA